MAPFIEKVKISSGKQTIIPIPESVRELYSLRKGDIVEINIKLLKRAEIPENEQVTSTYQEIPKPIKKTPEPNPRIITPKLPEVPKPQFEVN